MRNTLKQRMSTLVVIGLLAPAAAGCGRASDMDESGDTEVPDGNSGASGTPSSVDGGSDNNGNSGSSNAGGGGIVGTGGSSNDGFGGSGGSGNGGGSIDTEPGWASVVTPVAVGASQPYSCAALDGPSCWKTAVDAALACSPAGEGSFSPSGRTCTFPDGSRIDFSQSMAGREGYSFPELTVIQPGGEECYSIKSDGIGDFSLRAPPTTLAYESLSVLGYRIICENGSSLTNSGDGVCDSFSTRFLAGQTPVFTVSGSQDAEGVVRVRATISGSSSGRVVSWTCR